MPLRPNLISIVPIVNGMREVSFVVLQLQGENLSSPAPKSARLDCEHAKTLKIFIKPLHLRIRHKNHAVSSFQNETTTCLVKDLSGNGVHVKSSRRILLSWPSSRGKKSKKSVRSCSVSRTIISPFRVLSRTVWIYLRLVVFAAQSRTVINDLECYFLVPIIDVRHDPFLYLVSNIRSIRFKAYSLNWGVAISSGCSGLLPCFRMVLIAAAALRASRRTRPIL